MKPKRPYIMRAMYDWMLDNELTPHVVVNSQWPGTEVPEEYVQDGQIVLNIHPDATSALMMNDQNLVFQARFSGVPRKLVVPYGALLAIYAVENGACTIFEPEAAYKLSDGETGERKDSIFSWAEKQVDAESQVPDTVSDTIQNDKPTPQPTSPRPYSGVPPSKNKGVQKEKRTPRFKVVKKTGKPSVSDKE